MTGLPSRVTVGQAYPFQVPAALQPLQMTSNCGQISSSQTEAMFSTSTDVQYYCNITVDEPSDAVIWTFQGVIPAFFTAVPPRLVSLDLTVGVDMAPLPLPNRGIVVLPGSYTAHTVYGNITQLPPGITLDTNTGVVSGMPLQATNATTVVFVIEDVFTHLSAPIALVHVLVHRTPTPQASTVSNLALVIGVSVGGGFLLVTVVVLLALLRRQRQSKPHNFAEMLLALGDIEAEGAKRVPREIRRMDVQLLERIGKGHFGEVHKGVLDEIPGTPGYIVAVKSAKAAVSVDRGPILQEAALMAQFCNEYIVGLVGVVTAGEPLLVVLEYCEHGALNRYMQQVVVSERIKRQFAGDCASGMAYLASRRFVHRDLAARNILVSSAMRCKIGDFGLSRDTADSEYYQSIGGYLPVRWTAPEALEQRKYSQQSDVWSFGVVMYEMWTRCATPYAGMGNQQVWIDVLSGYRLPAPAWCPLEVYRTMQACWDVYGSRPTFVQLAQQLRQMEQNVPEALATQSVSDHATSQPPSSGIVDSRGNGQLTRQARAAVCDVQSQKLYCDMNVHGYSVDGPSSSAHARMYNSVEAGSTQRGHAVRCGSAERTTYEEVIKAAPGTSFVEAAGTLGCLSASTNPFTLSVGGSVWSPVTGVATRQVHASAVSMSPVWGLQHDMGGEEEAQMDGAL